MDPNALLKIIGDTHIVAQFQVAALSALCYDILLTLDQEIQYIWKKRWSWPKILYLLARYYSLLQLLVVFITASKPQTSKKLCQLYLLYYTTFGGAAISMMILYVILCVRLDALFGRQRRVRYFLWVVTIVGFIVEILGSVLIAVDAFHGVRILDPSMRLYGCTVKLDPRRKTRFMIIAWTASLMNSTVYFLLLVYRVYLEVTSSRRQGRLATILSSFTPLFNACYRDGFICYLAIEVILIATTAMSFKLTAGPLSAALIPFVTFVSSTCSTRLILHLRDTAERSMSSDSTTAVRRTTMDFAKTSRTDRIPLPRTDPLETISSTLA